MDKVRCLYFEDDLNQRQRYAGWIERGWNKLGLGVSIEVFPVETTDSAENKLKEAKEKFHVFVADILVGEKDEPLGLSAITHAREDDPDLAIVALSIGNGGFEQKAKKAGADEYVSKRYIIENEKENLLGEKILAALRAHGHEPVSAAAEILTYDTDDYSLSALIETIERENIINFAIRALNRTCKTIRPAFIRSGLSGASVVRVDCDYEVKETGIARSESRSLLLKVSKSYSSLENELSKDTSEFQDGLFIPFISDKPIRSGDWFAIVSKYKIEGKTLLDWLTSDGVPSTSVESALNSLFLDSDRGLQQTYRRTGWTAEERPNVALWNILSKGRGSRVLQALHEFKPLAAKYDRSNSFSEALISGFIKSKRVDALNEEDIKRGTAYCWSHGDLHGRNILISKADKGFLIDPANIEQLHWAADIARLCVDLIVSGLGRGAESHEWDAMTEWLVTSAAFIRGDVLPEPDEDAAKPLVSALNWLRTHLREIHGADDLKSKPEWEFKLALAVEFMRAAYRQQDLPTPKRVLGLIAACGALREACEAYKSLATGA